MTDDIVTRLREGCSECGLHTLYACTHEAADEIERLRRAIAELSRLASIGAIVPDEIVRKNESKWSVHICHDPEQEWINRG